MTERRFTPYDIELCVMIESLLGCNCELQGHKDGYTITADKSKYQSGTKYMEAVREAIIGRTGDRFVSMDESRDELVVRVRYAAEAYPVTIFCDEMRSPDPSVGEERMLQGNTYRVMKVSRENTDKLFRFVGNGEMEMRDPAIFHFLNADKSVFSHVPEGHYLVYYRDGLFGIVSESEFERR